MGVIHRSFFVAQEKFEYITSAVHEHAAKERVSLSNMLDVRSRNAGLIREKSLHFHVQFIFFPKEDNCIHHICGMMQINGLLIFPLMVSPSPLQFNSLCVQPARLFRRINIR